MAAVPLMAVEVAEVRRIRATKITFRARAKRAKLYFGPRPQPAGVGFFFSERQTLRQQLFPRPRVS